MKSREFAEILRRVAELSAESAVQQGIGVLARAFDEAGTATVASTLKRVAPDGGMGGGVPTGGIAAHLKRVQALLRLAGKTAATKDFSAFVQTVEGVQRVSFTPPTERNSRSSAPRKSTTPDRLTDAGLVEDYHRALVNVLGLEAGFPDVYDTLKTDPRMRVGELHELARRFAGAPGRSKAEALKKIWNRHQNLVVSRAKDRATAGRSAA